MEKIYYTIDEVSEITRLPQALIHHYLRVLNKTMVPEHYPDIHPRLVKGDLLFTRRDVDELLRFVDKKKDESWESWQMRIIKGIMAKRESRKNPPPQRPSLRLIQGKKETPEND